MPRKLNNTYPELVKKAQTLFWTNGFKSVKAEALAEHLGISPSTIYNKYSKEMLFIDALEDYVVFCSDPVLQKLRESSEGLESLREFFYNLIEALLDKTFPKSCLIVNTIVELRNEQSRVSKIYERYFENMTDSYKKVLQIAVDRGEIKQPDRIDEYAEFLLGVIFSLSILYKIKPQEELKKYIDDQISMIE